MHRLTLLALLALSSTAHSQDVSSAYTDRWQVYAYNLLRESIPYKTVRGEDHVRPFAEFLADQFLDNGFAAEDVHVIPMASGDIESTSLVVRYRGSSGKRPVLFVGHMDVVPAGAEDWGRDPFLLSEEDGYFFGRGVVDDKFATTIFTTTFIKLRHAGFRPERDLIIAFTGDEETRQADIKTLLREHRDLIDAEIALVADTAPGFLDDAGDPAAVFVQYAEKNYLTFEITARAPGGHSSQPSPDNSIYKLAAAITAIENTRFPVQADAANREFFRSMGKLMQGEVGAAMRRFGDDPDDDDAIATLLAAPGIAPSLGTTCVATMLRAGSAENALPEAATVTVNCRVYPGVSADDVQAHLERAVGNPEIEFVRTWDPVPAVPSPTRDDVNELLQSVVRQTTPEVPLVPLVGAGTTDGKFLRNAGIDAYGIMGFFIGAGEYAAHASDERIPVDSFFASLQFWDELVRAASAF